MGKVRIAVAAAILLVVGLALGCGTAHSSNSRRVIVLGFDGLDYELTRQLMTAGRLPNLAKLAQAGSFTPLQSSTPPQSPVAWSTFITGLDPGGHGIFDFIHRDPDTMVPYLSTTTTEAPRFELKMGRWQWPLVSGKVQLMRRGRPFWEVLGEHGIETTIIRMPANFPPSGSATRELSGMGTPDLLGTYGTFSFYTSNSVSFGKAISGGNLYRVDVVKGIVRGKLYGPDNPFLQKPESISAGFVVDVDNTSSAAKIVVGDEERVLRVGEWSDWVPVEFAPIRLQQIHGMCRFYLKQVNPYFELYVTPINLDPFSPALPISTPPGYASDLARTNGRFYTQGMPEDTKSLSEGVFSADEFLAQAQMAGDEVKRQLPGVLDKFKSGFLFYYFGNVDLVSHMMWRARDPEHPAYNSSADAKYQHVIDDLYVGLDAVVGETIDRLGDNTTLIVMSDHGFTSWRREFNLNAWLRDNGYLSVINPGLTDDPGYFTNIDWSRTRAYALGLNGLYLNLKGRERFGIVPPDERDSLLSEISAKLTQTIDDKTGQAPIARVFSRDKVYRGADPRIAPDLVIGYAKGFRSSNESSLGGVSHEVMSDNTSAWSGDHCMDPAVVPGILFASRPLKVPAGSLQDLAGAILTEFGISGFPTSP